MRALSAEEQAKLKALRDDLEVKMVALQDAEALFSQATAAMAYACGVPPREHVLAQDWTWHRVIGQSKDGQPVTQPVTMDAPE